MVPIKHIPDDTCVRCGAYPDSENVGNDFESRTFSCGLRISASRKGSWDPWKAEVDSRCVTDPARRIAENELTRLYELCVKTVKDSALEQRQKDSIILSLDSTFTHRRPSFWLKPGPRKEK